MSEVKVWKRHSRKTLITRSQDTYISSWTATLKTRQSLAQREATHTDDCKPLQCVYSSDKNVQDMWTNCQLN